ncbi:hypothetical protein [Actinosynnema sp. NPDC023587]|uniref:hypothetical protein n=1 Tax=Actinosynnema sp. NPDC023587 TaxID=3154695 RepID=UPI0033FAED2E
MTTGLFPVQVSPDGDARFTFGLVIEVADVLTRHGFPDANTHGADHVALRQALFRFLYNPDRW